MSLPVPRVMSLQTSADKAADALSEEDRSARERRARLAPGTAAGVTEAMIGDLVDAFYAAIRKDPELGPIFNARVADWPQHLAKLRDFWSSVVLMTGRFKGSPMRVHAELPGLGPAQFARWLELWRQTARAHCPPAAAELFIAKAEMIAESLQLGIAIQQGKLPPAPAPAGPAIPASAVRYSQTPAFTEDTVPAGLLRAHNTKPGVWGRIVVEAGALLYRVTDPRREPSEQRLVAGGPPGVVEPTILHEVQPDGPVRFHVEFYR